MDSRDDGQEADRVAIDSVGTDGFVRDENRLAVEVQILATWFPSFRWYRWNGETFAEGPLRTNGGSTYGVRVVLPHDYPHGIPTALFTHPTPLTGRDGRSLACSTPSAVMHLLSARDGFPVLCHYPPEAWTPNRTVYQVVVKARLWLEAYEAHLRTGEPIDTWLGHTGE